MVFKVARGWIAGLDVQLAVRSAVLDFLCPLSFQFRITSFAFTGHSNVAVVAITGRLICL